MDIRETDRRSGRRLRWTLLAATVSLLWSPTLPAHAEGARDSGAMTAAVSGGIGRVIRKVAPPAVLSDVDLAGYRQILALQRQGLWPQADRLLAEVKDDVLRGYVLAQRYLHPSYKASYAELKAWMAEHGDHPEAAAIHALAVQRGPKGDRDLKAPARARSEAGTGALAIAGGGDASAWEVVDLDAGGHHLRPAERRKLRALKGRVLSLARSNRTAAAVDLMRGPEVLRLADKFDLDQMATVVASAYFTAGQDAEALALAVPAASRSGEALPQAHWLAGLAYWRSGKPEQARVHFEAVGNATGAPAMISAGAYWAARANLVAKRPQVVNHWLEIAANHPRTFYGLLARRALGQSVAFAWEASPLTDVDAEILERVPAGRRALALLQLDLRDRAEEELRRMSGQATPAVARAMLALAQTAGMPDLVVQLGSRLAARDGRSHDSAAFPVPSWAPSNGWSIDRALMLAFARQESGFNPRARSPAGAIGLMQLMPATAEAVGGSRVSLDKLQDPAYNLALGQAYIRHLLAHETIRGNLFLLAAAYNSGPGNLERWLQTMKRTDDPLLFIESIPSRETRGFVEKVMTNLWIYRARLGLPMASLDAVVSGDWPFYDELDRRKPKPRNGAKN